MRLRNVIRETSMYATIFQPSLEFQWGEPLRDMDWRGEIFLGRMIAALDAVSKSLFVEVELELSPVVKSAECALRRWIQAPTLIYAVLN